MDSVSASVNLPLHHKFQKFSLAPAHPGDPGKRAVKQLWWWLLVSSVSSSILICEGASIASVLLPVLSNLE